MPTVTQEIGDWVGEQVDDELDLPKAVHRGLPLSVLSRFLSHGLTNEEFHNIVIPARTFKHRKAKVMPLSMEESDKALRAARVLAFAERTFGNREKALSWMRKPKKRFEGESPMAMLKTEAGARLVEEMLLQVDEGMFA
jgi:putative toxin-antitoxin system antitoxin component (TIGR02293 family)